MGVVSRRSREGIVGERNAHLGVLLRVEDGGDGDAEVGGRTPEI